MNDLEKARQLLLNKSIKAIDIAKKTGIAPKTLSIYVSHPEKMQVATWIRIHKLAVIFDEKKGEHTLEKPKPTELEKARKLLNNRSVSLKDLSRKLNIGYPTIRSYVSYPSKMLNVAWIRIYKLANYYDENVKEKI